VPDYEDRLSKFERMCVVKTFREDRTLVAAADYIGEALGQRFVESVPLSMERAWAESHKKCPLICLLSPGTRGLAASVLALQLYANTRRLNPQHITCLCLMCV
jgi:hypothetical protein